MPLAQLSALQDIESAASLRLVVHHVQLIMGMDEEEEPWVDDLIVDNTGELWGREARDAMRSLVQTVPVAATLPAAAICGAPQSSQEGNSITSCVKTDEYSLVADVLAWTS